MTYKTCACRDDHTNISYLKTPLDQGSALARALRPRPGGDDESMWDSAFNLISRTVLGTKAGLELACTESADHERLFGTLPNYCKVLVIAGDCGSVNPLLKGPNDGVVTVAEPRLDSQHLHLTLTAPHNLISDHPSAVRAVLAFMTSQTVPGAQTRERFQDIQ